MNSLSVNILKTALIASTISPVLLGIIFEVAGLMSYGRYVTKHPKASEALENDEFKLHADILHSKFNNSILYIDKMPLALFCKYNIDTKGNSVQVLRFTKLHNQIKAKYKELEEKD